MNEFRTSPSESPDALTGLCPSCHTRGLQVELGTVKALLNELAMRRVQAVSHRFCQTAECGVVYFDQAGATYEQADIRVRVWQKEPFGDRPVCYCFGETEATIREEFAQNGESETVQRVRVHIEANRCACDVRNPRSTCCLGDLTAAVKRVSSELVVERSVP